MSFVADRDPVRPGIHLNVLENRKNPYPVYEELRTHYPVCQLEPNGIWAVSRYEDVRFAATRPDLFSSSGLKALLQPGWLREECRRDLFILMQDPPDHRKFRALVNKAFIGRTISELVPLMQGTAQSLVSKIPANEETEFLEDFAYPYIGKIISHITGIEGQSLEEIRRWMGLLGRITPARPDQEYIEELEEAILAQKTQFESIIRERRNNPRQDLLSVLIAAEVDGEKLTDDMLQNALDLLLEAGFHTSLQMLCHAIILLSRRPDLMQSLVIHPGLIPTFIEELLRYETTAPILLRQTTGDVTLSGVTIPGDSTVLIMLAAANRDPEQFPDPDKFVIGRPNIKRHIAFGYGPHVCVGAALARQEIKIALEVILASFAGVACPPDYELSWTRSAMVRGVRALPVVFTKAGAGEKLIAL